MGETIGVGNQRFQGSGGSVHRGLEIGERSCQPIFQTDLRPSSNLT